MTICRKINVLLCHVTSKKLKGKKKKKKKNYKQMKKGRTD